jgi:hypothetical protein
VHPFASLLSLVPKHVPRLLINREPVGTTGQPILEALGFIDERALNFDEATTYRDACYLGDCDAGCRELAARLDALASHEGSPGGGCREAHRRDAPAAESTAAEPIAAAARSDRIRRSL